MRRGGAVGLMGSPSGNRLRVGPVTNTRLASKTHHTIANSWFAMKSGCMDYIRVQGRIGETWSR